GGWSLAPGASSTFNVPSGSVGRLWGRTGCDGSSPARCTTGQCGGTGLQCAGTTGQPNTSLFEWNVNANGTDWYDVSCVVANWSAVAQTYVNNVHNFCPRQYSYAYDEVAGGALQTCPTGSNFTIT